MARKKSKSTQAKIALTRLLEDEQVQKQLRTGALRLREAYARAARRPASKAVADKKIYGKVQEAAASFSLAAGRLRRKPEPPKRTGRKVVLAAAVAGGGVLAAKKLRGGGGQPQPEYPSAPPAPTTTPLTPVATPVPSGTGTPPVV